MDRDRKSDTPHLDMMLRYREQIEVILREGKTIYSLRNGDEFKSVPEHSKKVLTITDTLGKWIGLPCEEQETLNRTAALHDADKRLEKRPDEFTKVEKKNLEDALTRAGLDRDLLNATKEKFVVANIDNIDSLTYSQMILYYADMIVCWDQIVPFEDRLNESISRRVNYPGVSYSKELEFGKNIEKRIFSLLPEKVKDKVGTPEKIPSFLKSVLEGKQ